MSAERVQQAARAAAKKCGSTGDAHALYIALGDDYHAGRASVLRAMDYSDVVWSFQDDLVATPCSRSTSRSIWPSAVPTIVLTSLSNEMM